MTYSVVKAEAEEWYIVAKERVQALQQEGFNFVEVAQFPGTIFKCNVDLIKSFAFDLRVDVRPASCFIGSTYAHPLSAQAFKVIGGSHVTAESGTGLVHTAPGHGMDDYEVCRKLGILPWSPGMQLVRFFALDAHLPHAFGL